MTFERALEDLLEDHADRVCAKHSLRLHPETRLKLLAYIATPSSSAPRPRRVGAGDYSAEPTWPVSQPYAATKVTVPILFERWCESNKARVEASTIRRYTPSLNSLGKLLRR